MTLRNQNYTKAVLSFDFDIGHLSGWEGCGTGVGWLSAG
jgi:hypothetical protein